MFRALSVVLVGAAVVVGVAQAAEQPPPLVLETKISLGAVSGRIDHLAVDVKRRRLFVAELGNNSLGIVDLAAQRLLQTMPGLKEPQGIGYEPTTDTIYVANAGDGSVRLLRGEDFGAIGQIDLGDDADNVRIDPAHRRVLVGYGDGGLAMIDPVSRAKTGDLWLPAHPESFQLFDEGKQAAINLPKAHRIDIADLTGNPVRSIPTGALSANFPMAVDAAAGRFLVVFRNPPMLAAYTTPAGQLTARLPICADADDLFVDAKRRRIYVSCGAGIVDVLEPTADGFARVAQIPTASGARTALFVPEFDRLFVAVRASAGEPAAIWVFRPSP